MQVVVDGRYFCSLHRSLATFTGNLLRALVSIDAGPPPVVLIPGELHPISHSICEDLADQVRWVRPARPIEHIGRMGPEIRWVHREMPRLLRESVPSAELIIMPYHHPPFRTPGVRRAVILHDLCGLGVGFPKTKKNYWRHYLRLRAAAHMADVIWPISEATREEMATRFPASRSRLGPIVYNGVDREAVSDFDLQAALSTFGLQRREYVIAYMTWQERKNSRATVSALQLMREQGRPVRLVGIAPEGEVDSIREWCRVSGLADSAIFSGVTDAEMDALYSGAIALVWPSLCEGFGYPVVEAMAQGCPPLVWRVGPGAELVNGAIEPLLDLESGTIAQRVGHLLEMDPDHRRLLERRLRNRARVFSLAEYKNGLASVIMASRT